MDKTIRKEIKQPDAFMTATAQAMKWLEKNKAQARLAAGVLGAVVLGGIGLATLSEQRQRQANDDLAQGLALIRAEKWSEGAKSLTETASRWGGNVGAIAQLYAGQAQLRGGAPDAAKAAVASVSIGDVALDQLAKITAASAIEESGDAGKAAEAYSAARAASGPYSAVALLGEARCREAAGQADKALELYKAFRAEYPESGDASFVAEKLGGSAPKS